MKLILASHPNLLAVALTVLGVQGARADLFSVTTPVNLAIPDDDSSGLISLASLTTSQIVTDVDVSLSISGGPFGGWNGDLYAWLQHDAGFSVLLNRPGRTAVNLLGYSDNGFLDVRFDNEAPNDIHQYQVSLGVAPGLLVGAWQPDGRLTDPAAVLDTDPRSASLSSFDGLSAGGDWKLFVADVGGGGEFTLEAWTLTVTTSPAVSTVPESAPGWMALGFLLVCVALRRQQC